MVTSRAAISDGNGNIQLTELEVDAPGPGEVLVRIKASGVCHTDWDFVINRPPVHVMGHEGAGIVTAVGEGVTAYSKGDKVLLNWAIPCGQCNLCLHGYQNICDHKPTVPLDRMRHEGKGIVRSFALGTMTEYTVVPEAALSPIHVDIPWTSACIMGCGVMTGYGSVVNTARVQAGSSVVVLGAGGVGLNCIQGAKIAGAGKIITIDVNQQKLAWARQFGTTHTILADRADTGLLKAAEQVRTITGHGGADYAFECTAVPELGFAPLAMVRHGGMAVEVSGVDQSIEVDMLLLKWDKTYIQPKYGSCNPAVDFPRMLDLYDQKRLKLDELVTRTYTLDLVEQAFDDMHAGVNAKGVILMDEVQ